MTRATKIKLFPLVPGGADAPAWLPHTTQTEPSAAVIESGTLAPFDAVAKTLSPRTFAMFPPAIEAARLPPAAT